MTEEKIIERFEENEKAIEEYKKQLDSLREDLKIVIKHSPRLRDSILETINQPGNPRFQAEIPRLLEFRDKYDVRVRYE
jgi:hypothetical protein